MRPGVTAALPHPRPIRILESALYVADVERARHFYVELLGAGVLLASPRLVALDAGQGTVLLLFARGATAEPLPTPGGVVPGHGADGVQHLAFAIERATLDHWRTRLRELAIPVESEVTWPRGGMSLYFRDPDGHSLELATPGLWASY